LPQRIKTLDTARPVEKLNYSGGKLGSMEEFLGRCRRWLPAEITSEEMAAIEENAESLGFPRTLMMENAGLRVADSVARSMDVRGRSVLFVCGTGNNGGDGFVVARHLRNAGARIVVFLLGRPDEIRTEEAKLNWHLIEQMDDVRKFFLIDSSQIPQLERALGEVDVVVDAITGTGVRGALREPAASAVVAMNRSGKPVFAVDSPSGLNPSTGEVHGVSVRAVCTVTFHKMKAGFAGREEYTGRVLVEDIGIPLEAEFFTGPGDVRRVVKPRRPYSHKGDYGYVLVVGGSETYSGAPALAALSSLRTGAGLAHVLAPESVANSIRQMSPDLIVHVAPSARIDASALDILKGLIDKVDCVVLGPGLGLHEDTVAVVPEILAMARGKPVVLDADGFKAVKTCPEALEGTVATPHAGEFRGVFGIKVGERWWEKVDAAVEVAERYRFVLLLKGHDTVVTDGRRVKVNRRGTPGMAVGGTGDILSGVLATFLGAGRDKFLSAAAAAYVHGDAGVKAVRKMGFHIVASDLLEEIPEVLKPFDRELEE